MSTTSIGTSWASDPFYRYKRPVAILSSTKKGTEITNLQEIAKSLRINPEYILHWIKIQKATSCIKGMIRCEITVDEVEDILNELIEEIVLCDKCDYPEVTIVPNKKVLLKECAACGNCVKLAENKYTKIVYKTLL